MENLKEIFNNFYRIEGSGGIYDNYRDDNLLKIQNNVILSCKELIGYLRETNINLPDVHIDFINNSKFEACTFKSQGIYFIGFNIGLIKVLLRLFNYIMSTPNIHEHIGNHKLELESDIINDIDISNYKYLDLFMDNETEVYMPICQERKRHAFKCFFSSIEFLFTHEYAHIIMGHIDYQNSKNEVHDFSFNETPEFGSNALYQQTLEMDADSYATKIGFHRLISIYEHNYKLDSSIKFEDYLFNWYFLIFVMIRLFGTKELDLDKLKGSSHPAPGIRQWHIFQMLRSLLEQEEYSDYQRYKTKLPHIFNQVVTECNNVLRKISSKTFTVNPLSILLKDEGYYEIFRIMNNWQYIRPELIPFATVNLAPIDNWNESDFRKSPFS